MFDRHIGHISDEVFDIPNLLVFYVPGGHHVHGHWNVVFGLFVSRRTDNDLAQGWHGGLRLRLSYRETRGSDQQCD